MRRERGATDGNPALGAASDQRACDIEEGPGPYANQERASHQIPLPTEYSGRSRAQQTWSIDMASQDVPCPFSSSPVKMTKSGCSASSAHLTSASVDAYAPLSHGEVRSQQGLLANREMKVGNLPKFSSVRLARNVTAGQEKGLKKKTTLVRGARVLQRTQHTFYTPYRDGQALCSLTSPS